MPVDTVNGQANDGCGVCKLILNIISDAVLEVCGAVVWSFVPVSWAGGSLARAFPSRILGPLPGGQWVPQVEGGVGVPLVPCLAGLVGPVLFPLDFRLIGLACTA